MNQNHEFSIFGVDFEWQILVYESVEEPHGMPGEVWFDGMLMESDTLFNVLLIKLLKLNNYVLCAFIKYKFCCTINKKSNNVY